MKDLGTPQICDCVSRGNKNGAEALMGFYSLEQNPDFNFSSDSGLKYPFIKDNMTTFLQWYRGKQKPIIREEKPFA